MGSHALYTSGRYTQHGVPRAFPSVMNQPVATDEESAASSVGIWLQKSFDCSINLAVTFDKEPNSVGNEPVRSLLERRKFAVSSDSCPSSLGAVDVNALTSSPSASTRPPIPPNCVGICSESALKLKSKALVPLS